MIGRYEVKISELKKAIAEFKKWAVGLQLTKEETEDLGHMLKPITWLRENKEMPDAAFFVAYGYHDWVQRSTKASKTSISPWGFSLHSRDWPKGNGQTCPFVCQKGRAWHRREPRPDIVLMCMINDLAAMERTKSKNKGA